MNPTFYGIRRVSKAGGSLSTLVENEKIVDLVLANDGYLYWTEWNVANTDRIRRMKKSGGAVETVISGQVTPSSLYADAQYLYWQAVDHEQVV